VRGQGGDGGERERSQGEGAKSKPGLRCNEFPLYLFWGGDRAEASSVYAMAAKRPYAV
jgi:hypothetical protein